MILSNEERIYTLEAVVALTLIPRNNNNTTESNPINLSSNNSQANGNQIAPNLSQANGIQIAPNISQANVNQIAPNLSQANSSSTSPSLESIQAQLNIIISSLQALQTRVSSLENDVNEIKSKIQGKQ